MDTNAYSTSSTVQDTCKNVIESVYPKLKGKINWISPDKCMLTGAGGGTGGNTGGSGKCVQGPNIGKTCSTEAD